MKRFDRLPSNKLCDPCSMATEQLRQCGRLNDAATNPTSSITPEVHCICSTCRGLDRLTCKTQATGCCHQGKTVIPTPCCGLYLHEAAVGVDTVAGTDALGHNAAARVLAHMNHLGAWRGVGVGWGGGGGDVG